MSDGRAHLHCNSLGITSAELKWHVWLNTTIVELQSQARLGLALQKYYCFASVNRRLMWMEGRQPTPCHLQFSLLRSLHRFHDATAAMVANKVPLHQRLRTWHSCSGNETPSCWNAYGLSCLLRHKNNKKKLEILTERDFAFIYSLLNYKMNTWNETVLHWQNCEHM